MNETTGRTTRPRWRIRAALLAYQTVSLSVLGQGAKLPEAEDLRSHGVTQAQIDSIAEIPRAAVEEGRIAGCSFLVAHKGEAVFREGFGYADLESKRPFTTEELCLIASVSKPILSTVMMVLVEQGKLELDDRVENYLSEFKGIRVEGSRSPARPMTVRQLLSHTAGFWGNQAISPEKLDLIRNFERPLAEAVSGIARHNLVFEPGTRYLYSGAGYCVAGRVAEVACGRSLEEIAQDALFRPSGMKRSTYLPSKEARQTLPARYLRRRGKLVRQPSLARGELRFILPGGSLHTTLNELAVFGQMHLNEGVYGGRRILSKASVNEMQRRQTPRGDRARYGLGWACHDLSEDGLARVVTHGGALGAMLWVDRRRQLVGVFLTHQTAGQVKDLRERLWERVTELFSEPDGD